MGSAKVTAGNSTWVSQNYPTKNKSADKYLALRDTSVGENGGVGLIYFKSPVPAGATVTSAKLRIRTIYASPNGSTATVSLRRVIQSWSESRVTFNTYPTYTAGAQASVSLAPATPSGTWLEFDVTAMMQAYSDGLPNYGFRIDTTVQAGVLRLRGFKADYKPELIVEWSDVPFAPTNLKPAGVIGGSHPIVSFDHVDVSGSKTIAAVQVQIDGTGDFTTPDFDSGEVVTNAAEVDLSATAFAGLADGQTVFYRMRVQDGDGLWSDWSDDAEMSRAVQPSLTILQPTEAVGFLEPSPPILWSTTNQTAWRVQVFDYATGATIHDTKVRSGADSGYTIPRLKDGQTVRVVVDVRDNVEGRVSAPGDPYYVRAEVVATVNVDPSTDAPINVTAEQVGVTPSVDLAWERASLPDQFAVLANGVIVDLLESPADYTSDGVHYAYTYEGAVPNVPTDYTVRAVVNGAQSPDSVAAPLTTDVAGIWLTLDGASVCLMGDDEGTWEMPEDATVYTPLGGKGVTRVTQGRAGWQGNLSGYIMDTHHGNFAGSLATMYAIKRAGTDTVRLVAGDVNFRALVGDVAVAPVPTVRKGQRFRKTTFAFWQVDDFEF